MTGTVLASVRSRIAVRAPALLGAWGHELLVLSYSVAWLMIFVLAGRFPALLPVVNITYFGMGAFTVWAMIRAASAMQDGPATARAWRLLAFAAAAIVVSGVVWTVAVVPAVDEATPWWSYVSDAAYAPMAIAAFLSFPQVPVRVLRRRELLLDAALLALGIVALSWYFSFRPLVIAPDDPTVAWRWFEAVVAWLVVVAACWGYLRAADALSRTAIALLMTSQVVFIISGLVFAPGGRAYQAGDPVDAVFFAAWLFRWLAARWARRGWAKRASAPEAERALDAAPAYGSSVAPAVFVAGAFAVLVYVVFADRTGLFGSKTGVAVVASAMTWLLVARHAAHLLTTREQLRAAESQKGLFSAIMDSLSDYIFVTDAAGRVTWASASAVEVFALEEQPRFASLVHPDDAAVTQAWLPASDRALSAQPLHVRLRRADGQWAPVELRGNDVRDDPVVAGLVINGTDRTAEVALEERVRHAEKLATLHDMAGRIAHAFNNVLAVVQGHAELLAADPTLDDAWHADVSDMRSAANRGASITRQLLGFSGRQVIHTEALDVSAVVEDVLPTWRRLLPPGVSVRLEGDVGAVRAYVDRAQLEQVLLNLVVNARDAMPDGGDIIIFVARGEAADGSRRILVSVRDSGMGMNAEQQARIFEPFFTTKAPGVGTGLGLAMVDTIVRRSGGDITVVSAVGEGSTFTVSLPAVGARSSGAMPVPLERPEPVVAGAAASVLLVDDEDAVRHVSARILARSGFRVRSCSGGAEALEVVATPGVSIDVVVTDMMMPGMSGRELIDQLVVTYPHLPIIVITGFASDVDTRAPMPPQVQRIIEKPFEAAELIGAVRRAASARAG